MYRKLAVAVTTLLFAGVLALGQSPSAVATDLPTTRISLDAGDSVRITEATRDTAVSVDAVRNGHRIVAGARIRVETRAHDGSDRRQVWGSYDPVERIVIVLADGATATVVGGSSASRAGAPTSGTVTVNAVRTLVTPPPTTTAPPAPTTTAPPRTTTTTTPPRTTTTAPPRTTTTTTAPPRTTTTTAPPRTTTTTTAPPPAAPQNGDANGDGWVRVGEDPVRPTFGSAIPVQVQERRAPKNTGEIGFTSNCSFDESLRDDAIVFPGQSGRSHLHDFFGNRSTDAFTSSQSLVDNTATTCPAQDDQSAYWFPSLYDGGQKMRPKATSFYYKRPLVTDFEDKIQAYPLGFRMIAGNANATKVQDARVGWFEEHRNARNNTESNGGRMVDANKTGKIIMKVEFPDCWDGKHLDSPDHKSHVAYSHKWKCPSTHPVPIPRLVSFVTYVTDGGAGITLSSGPWYTLHGDFWNGWHPETLQKLVDTCVTGKVHCDRVADDEGTGISIR